MLLKRDFYTQNTTQVAQALLGKVLHVQDGQVTHQARIVETEAYLGKTDPACHTFGGRCTPRVQSMYLPGGHTYVYLIYGMYYCLNVVTRTEQEPEAVLIRAVEPLPFNFKCKKEIPTNGPGKLCRHYHITKADDGLSLWKKTSRLFITEDSSEVNPEHIHKTSRIGVEYAGDAAGWPLRFYLKDNAFVSRR